MKSNIFLKNLELTERMGNYVTNRNNILSQKLGENLKAYWTIEVIRENYQVHLHFQSNEGDLNIESINEDFFTAFDKVCELLEKQYARLKQKKRDISLHSSPVYVPDFLENQEDEVEVAKDSVIKRKKFNLKPMMEEEAILQMQLLKHNFFFFYNGNTNSMCLLYKRKDGYLGLIEGVQ